MISVMLLVILCGGLFITSGLFKESLNSPKEYFILISMTILLSICVMVSDGLQKLVKSLKSRLFLNGVGVVCLLTTIYGFLQYFGLILSNHSAFPITGTYENPAGFAVVQAAMFPFVFTRCFDRESGWFLKVFSIIVSVLCTTSVILAGSRTGFLAICAAIVVVLALTDVVSSSFKVHRWLWILFITLVVTCAIILYCLKKDSADGRMFIWSCCFDMIKKHPFLGYGVDGFHRFYMSTQANYFRIHPDSPYVMLADNTLHPFNEYIKLTVNYGLLGFSMALLLLVCIVRKLFKCERGYKVLGLSFVASVFTMCQFSYPFEYAVVWLLTIVVVIPAFIKPRKQYVIPRLIAVLTCLLSMAFMVHTLRKMYYEMKWTEISKRSQVGQAERMLKYYKGMPKIVKRNPLFLYNYAAELYLLGDYEESLVQSMKCAERWNDYQVQLMLANNYINLSSKDKAIQSLDEACNMIPCRYEPLYGKMLLYKSYGDTINAVRTANDIIEKPYKIWSERVTFIVGQAKQLLLEYD